MNDNANFFFKRRAYTINFIIQPQFWKINPVFPKNY